MTADVELLPLPPLGECSEDSVQEWGRANVAHATAAKDAEIDALRTRLEDTVRDSTNKIEALRAEVGRMKDMAMMQAARAAAAEREVSHRKARAERLAEALRELRNHTSVNSDQIALIDAAIDQARGKAGGEVGP